MTKAGSLGGAYNFVFGDRVDFAQFGKTLMATNVNDVVQSIDIDSGTNFAALAGSPPMAKYIEIVGDFVMLGSISSYPQRVVWSAINDSTGWTAGTNQSDFQDFPEGGHIVGIIGGQGGLIFQEEVIRRMTYTGPPTIFQFDKVADRGLLAPFSLVRIGDVAYGLSRDGFISVSMGGQMGMIGKEKIDRWFFNDASAGEIRTVKGVADRFQTKIYWSYKSTISPYDSILCFDYALNRWSYCRLHHSEIITAATQGYTLEGLDALGFTLDELAGIAGRSDVARRGATHGHIGRRLQALVFLRFSHGSHHRDGGIRTVPRSKGIRAGDSAHR